MLDDPALQDLLETLVSVESVNPDLVRGAAGEGRLGDFVGAWLAERGVEVSYQDVTDGRRNVIGRVRGSGGRPSLLLNAHLDTVGTASMPDAGSPRVEGGRLYGRGAQDMKSGLAAAMAVTEAALGMRLAGDLILAAVVDEEGDSKGTEVLLRDWTAGTAIALEPTGHVIAPVHKGFLWADIETIGVAAHGSDPDNGVDAIVAMGGILVELGRLAEELRRRAPGPAGTGSLHASLIEGGTEPCTYPGRCSVVVERRTVPGETDLEVLEELKAAVAAAQASAGTAWSATVSLRLARPPLTTPSDAPVVRALQRACKTALGSAQLGSAAFWTDASLMSEAGIPSVVFGVAGGGMHSASEWVELSSLRAVTDVLALAVHDLLG